MERDMRDLLIKALENKANLTKSDIQYLNSLEGCLSDPRYSFTQGQFASVNKMCQKMKKIAKKHKKSSSLDDFSL